jgi:hypothetical protein
MLARNKYLVKILWKKYYPETAPPGDPSHEPLNPDTFADANKILLTGDW